MRKLALIASAAAPADRPFVAIVGAGPAGLMAAELLAEAGLRVIVYDRMPSVGRKFLMAGRGGLNLTHSEPVDDFVQRYGEARHVLQPMLEAFPPAALRRWAEELGQLTFVGSSGRVFPRGFKTSPLLRAWLLRLDRLGVGFALRHQWLGFAAGRSLRFAGPDGPVVIAPDAVVLALGGASWPRLGSDGSFADVLRDEAVPVSRLRPANCGFAIAWSEGFAQRFAGQPLKHITVSFAGRRHQGDAMITQAGIEGTPIYALSAALREAIDRTGQAILEIDLKPGLSETILAERLAASRQRQSLSTFLRKRAKLSPLAIKLMREQATVSAENLAAQIKGVKLCVRATLAIDRAISTAGGVAFDALDEALMLRARPGVFLAGEMLDWEAPTGGYLLQGCFSTAFVAAAGLRRWLVPKTQKTGLAALD
jgi:uncharacterized flavoprotein (TIGR03862 family)